MEQDNRIVIKTKSGRISRQLYQNLNFNNTRKSNQKKKKFNMLRDEDIARMEQERQQAIEAAERERQQQAAEAAVRERQQAAEISERKRRLATEAAEREREQAAEATERERQIAAERERQQAIVQQEQVRNARNENLLAMNDAQRIQLERQRELLENMRIQLARLENDLNAAERQREEPPQIARGHMREERVEVMRDFGSILNNLQVTNVEIKIPKFGNETEKNPKAFLEELERYFRIKNINIDSKKLVLAEHALEDQARIWIRYKRDAIVSYGQFKIEFLEEFYSVPIRVKLENKWYLRRYSIQDGNLLTYFYSQTKEASFFEPQLSEYKINYNTVQQMPYRVRENLATINFTDTKVVAQALAQFDNVQKDNPRFSNINNNNDKPQSVGVRHMHHIVDAVNKEIEGNTGVAKQIIIRE